MTAPLDNFNLDDHLAPPEAAPPAPAKVFVRNLSAPPGLPWEQARAALMDARHSAPMPIQELALQMRRLEPWRLGAPSRFAALYVPLRAVGERLEATVTIDGVPTQVVFLSAGAKTAGGRRLLYVAAATAACVAITVVALGAAFSRKADTEAQLSVLEGQATARARAVAGQQRLRDQDRALDRAPERGTKLSSVLSDLSLATSNRSPDATISAVHWESGAIALEVRGDGAPLQGRTDWSAQRAAKPIRHGVWLWILKRNALPQSKPVSAELRDGGPR